MVNEAACLYTREQMKHGAGGCDDNKARGGVNLDRNPVGGAINQGPGGMDPPATEIWYP